MVVTIDGKRYFRTAEACHLAGITKNTFLRWVSMGSYPDVEIRDRRGWRLFSEEEVARLVKETNRTNNSTKK